MSVVKYMYIVRPKVLYTIKEEAITVLQIWRYWSMWTLNYTKCHLTRLFDRMMTLSDLLATKQDLPKYIGTSICRTTPGNDKYIYLSRNNDCSTAICTYHTRWKCMVNVKVMAIKFIVCSRQGLFIRVFFCLCLYIPVPCSLIGEQSLYAAFKWGKQPWCHMYNISSTHFAARWLYQCSSRTPTN